MYQAHWFFHRSASGQESLESLGDPIFLSESGSTQLIPVPGEADVHVHMNKYRHIDTLIFMQVNTNAHRCIFVVQILLVHRTELNSLKTLITWFYERHMTRHGTRVTSQEFFQREATGRSWRWRSHSASFCIKRRYETSVSCIRSVYVYGFCWCQ